MAIFNFLIFHEISRFFTISTIRCGYRKFTQSMYSHMMDTLPKIKSFISCQTPKIEKMTNFVLPKLQSEIWHCSDPHPPPNFFIIRKQISRAFICATSSLSTREKLLSAVDCRCSKIFFFSWFFSKYDTPGYFSDYFSLKYNFKCGIAYYKLKYLYIARDT